MRLFPAAYGGKSRGGLSALYGTPLTQAPESSGWPIAGPLCLGPLLCVWLSVLRLSVRHSCPCSGHGRQEGVEKQVWWTEGSARERRGALSAPVALLVALCSSAVKLRVACVLAVPSGDSGVAHPSCLQEPNGTATLDRDTRMEFARPHWEALSKAERHALLRVSLADLDGKAASADVGTHLPARRAHAVTSRLLASAAHLDRLATRVAHRTRVGGLERAMEPLWSWSATHPADSLPPPRPPPDLAGDTLPHILGDAVSRMKEHGTWKRWRWVLAGEGERVSPVRHASLSSSGNARCTCLDCMHTCCSVTASH